MKYINKKLMLLSLILISAVTIANDQTNSLQEVLSKDEGDHCFVLANRAFSIMGLRQDGVKQNQLIKELRSVDEKYNKDEINELIQKAYKAPITPDAMGKMVVMSNFMSDIEQECMKQKSDIQN
ncbi:hypothetical protein [Acinetobacter pittii]|uniref:hypothetical protein n=1 Tax=Acinetobacter pittii TaxID=48296 RepID=UPI0030084E43